MSLQPHIFTELSEKLKRPEEFAVGSSTISNAAIQAAKSAFDHSLSAEPSSIGHINALLSSLTPFDAPQTRSKSQTKTSAPPSTKLAFNPTPLNSLFVDELEEEQVWAQLELRTKHICDLLDVVLEGEIEDPDIERDDEEEGDLRKALAASGITFGDDDDEDEFENDDDSELESEEDDFEDDDGSDSDSEDNETGDWSGEENMEGMAVDEDSEDESEDVDVVHEPLRSPSKKRTKRASEVDDDFFDLASFKSEVERAEAKSSTRGGLAIEDESDDESDIGSVDLFASVDDEDMEVEDVKELFYGDFFEPPKRTPTSRPSEDSGKVRFHDQVRVKKISNLKKSPKDDYADILSQNGGLEEEQEEGEEDADDSDASSESGHESDTASDLDEEGQLTIERLKDDLFADEEDDAQKDMSTHEKRMTALQAQISELETENISRKEWTLMGEADTRSRPQNSLLEEDLEFDRAMKPVPVITEEKVQSLEELIKARIKENRFDDVIRIRPMDDKAFLPSRILELQDTKSTQSLSQIYENDYMAAQGDTSKLDDRDGKLKKEHDEIELLWDKICEKLDALSNAHYVPKQPKSIISTVADVSTAAMESALPTAKSATSMLAPEEIFAAENSQLRARSELEPNEKRALRAKERKLKKKQRDLLDKTIDKTARARSIGGVKKQKQAALASIVKSGKGITVVGKTAKDLKNASDRRRKRD